MRFLGSEIGGATRVRGCGLGERLGLGGDDGLGREGLGLGAGPGASRLGHQGDREGSRGRRGMYVLLEELGVGEDFALDEESLV